MLGREKQFAGCISAYKFNLSTMTCDCLGGNVKVCSIGDNVGNIAERQCMIGLGNAYDMSVISFCGFMGSARWSVASIEGFIFMVFEDATDRQLVDS
jgi:hypothetical protein